MSSTARKLSTLSISGLIVLFAILPFLSSTTAAALPSNCTQSGISVSCTYYADSALSTSSLCYYTSGSSYLPTLDGSVPAAGTTFNASCAVYAGPEIQVTGLSITTYLGQVFVAFTPAFSKVYAGPSADAIASGSYLVGYADIGQLPSGGGSCSSPSLSATDETATLSSGSIVVSPGEVLTFYPGSGEAAACTGVTAGGQDTPTSFTITGNEVGTTTVTTTATQTQTSTASVTSTVTAIATSTTFTTTMVTTGACITATATPQAVPEVPQQDPTTVTSTVDSTTTIITTTVLTTTITTTIPVTETRTQTTCTTTSNPTTVPQFPIAGLGALALVALLLPVLALLIRLRRSSIPSSAV